MVYLRARWYNPGSGTLTTRDPFAGFPKTPYSLHPYQYAYSNPVLFVDPTGEQIDDPPMLPPHTRPCDKEPAFLRSPRCLLLEAADQLPQSPETVARAKRRAQLIADSSAGKRVFLDTALAQLIADLWHFSQHPVARAIQARLSLWNLFDPECFGRDRALAYLMWINFVKTGAPLDVKSGSQGYRQRFGNSLTLFGRQWTHELSGNLLYGFVGVHVGFTAFELQEGAGAAQYKDWCIDSYAPHAVGPGAPGCIPIVIRRVGPRRFIPFPTSPRTWDEDSDQAGIEAGIALYRRFSRLFLTPYHPGQVTKKAKALAQILLPYDDRITNSGP